MKTLHHEGRLVAICKRGRWEPVGNVGVYEYSEALRRGTVVTHKQKIERYNPLMDILGMIISMAVVGFILFNLQVK